MDISSLKASESGIRASAEKNSVRAHNIANINTEGFSGSRVVQASVLPSGTKVASIDKTGEDTISDVVNIKTAKHANSANAKVIKVADEMLGTLLDIKS